MRKKNKKFTFTKVLMVVYSMAFIIWITWSYVLASLGRHEIAQDLSSQVVIVGVAAVLGYLLKSYFETYSEEYNKLQREAWKHELEMAKAGCSVSEEIV